MKTQNIIFKHPTKGFVVIRENNGAFGNKVKTLHYTPYIDVATRFYSDVRILPSESYKGNFQGSHLDAEISELKLVLIEVETTIKVLE